jgi:hypothetical protein
MSADINFQRSEKPKAGPENSAALFVSLYVVILAFFILLTSNAQFDVEKTKHVAESVKKAFSMDIPTETRVKVPSVGSELSVTQFFQELQSAVKTVVPLEEMEVITDGRNMVMIMDSTALYNRDDTNLRYDRRAFYKRLSDVMTKWRDGMRMTLSLVQGVPQGSPAGLYISRAGNFARFMENQGAAPESLSVGLAEREKDTITLTFDVLEFDATKLDLAPEEQAPAPAPTGAIRLDAVKGAQP